MKDDKIYVSYILECVSRIEQYAGNDRDIFMKSTLIQDAVLRNLQTLAESTQRLSDEIKNNHSEVQWRNIAGFRNILVHDYLGGINLNQVWKVIDRDLPVMKDQMSAILEGLEN